MADDPNNQMDSNIVTPPGLDARDTNILWSSRRKMAWVSLWGIIVPTLFIILRVHDVNMLDKLADLMSWYYIALTSIVGAYFGFKSWAVIRGRGKVDSGNQ